MVRPPGMNAPPMTHATPGGALVVHSEKPRTGHEPPMNHRASLRGSRPKATPDGSLMVHTRDDDDDDDGDDDDDDGGDDGDGVMRLSCLSCLA